MRQSAIPSDEKSPLTNLSPIEADDVLEALHEMEEKIEELDFEKDQNSEKKRGRENSPAAIPTSSQSGCNRKKASL
jgi:hypothetical protein